MQHKEANANGNEAKPLRKKVLVKKKPTTAETSDVKTSTEASNPFGAVLKKTPTNVCFAYFALILMCFPCL